VLRRPLQSAEGVVVLVEHALGLGQRHARRADGGQLRGEAKNKILELISSGLRRPVYPRLIVSSLAQAIKLGKI
jgi:hypothetical protein